MRDPRDKRPRAIDFRMNGHRTQLNMQATNGINGTDPQVLRDIAVWEKTATVLSSRELEVLRLISFGHSTKEIADRLFLSAHTVTNHRKNMLSRSRCGNCAELVRVAIMENLL